MSKYAKEVNECLISIQKGNQSEIKTLIDLTSNHLKAIIKGYLVNKVYLNDVLLETYERVLLYIKSFNRRLDGYNWMCKIAQNLSYAYNKDDMRTKNIEDFNEKIVSTDCQEDIETRMDLALAMRSFGEKDKKIAYMRFYMQESLSEISKEIGISKPAVHKRLKKIQEVIRKNY